MSAERAAADGPGGQRLALAMLASAVTGVVIYWLVVVRGLPALAQRLSDAQILALRDHFRAHPVRVLAAVCAAAAALGLPVLGVFRLVSGPLSGPRGRRRQ